MSFRNLTNRQKGKIKELKSKGFTPKQIAERLSASWEETITSKQISNFLYRGKQKVAKEQLRKIEKYVNKEYKRQTSQSPEEVRNIARKNIEWEKAFGKDFDIPSGRTDELASRLQKLTPKVFRSMNSAERDALLSEMRTSVSEELNRLMEADIETYATDTMLKNINLNKHRTENIYLDIVTDENDKLRQFDLLRDMIYNYKTATLEGAIEQLDKTEGRLLELAPSNFSNSYEKLSFNDRKEFWEEYRKLVNKATNLKTYVKEKQSYIFGSDLIQRLLYQEEYLSPNDSAFESEDDLISYITKLNDRMSVMPETKRDIDKEVERFYKLDIRSKGGLLDKKLEKEMNDLYEQKLVPYFGTF